MQPAAEVNECEEIKQQNLCIRKEAAYFISKLLFLTYCLLCRCIPPAALPLFLHTYSPVSSHWGSSSSDTSKHAHEMLSPSPSPSEVNYQPIWLSCCLQHALAFRTGIVSCTRCVGEWSLPIWDNFLLSSCGLQSRQAVTHRTSNESVVKFHWFYWNNLYA